MAPRKLHTLGPSGTNCQKAALEWLERHASHGEVILHETLEQAVETVCEEGSGSALLACIVYPELHTLVFSNLDRLTLTECFVTPTHDMILASRRDKRDIHTVATHPAPQRLVPSNFEKLLVHSNAAAAAACQAGTVDACITTIEAATLYDLELRQNFGPVAMGFSIHVPH